MMYLLLSISSVFARQACFDFDDVDAELCVNIDRSGNDYDVESTLKSWKKAQIYCQIKTPQNIWATIYSINNCNDSFEYDWSRNGELTVYMYVDTQIITAYYDIDDEAWDEEGSHSIDDNNSNNNGEAESIRITPEDSSPDTNERIDVTFEIEDEDGDTVEDYRNGIEFDVYYRTSSSSSRTKTTSSTYYEISSSYEDGYAFRSLDDGERKITNFIRFKKEYEYRLDVKDEDDSSIDWSRIFSVWSSDDNNSNNNGEAESIRITPEDSSPDTNERIDVTFEIEDEDGDTVEDYRNGIEFTVYYRTSNSSSRTKTTSSSYYEISTSYRNGYTFRSSDDGKKKITNFIRFKKEYDFRIDVEDEDDSSLDWTRIIYVGGADNNDDDNDNDNDSNNDNGEAESIRITPEDSTPVINERIDMTFEIEDENGDTVEDYRNGVEFSVYFRLSTNGNRTKTTSSSYYELNDTYKNGYTFRSIDDGEKKITNFIRFKRDYDFRVDVEDEDDSSVDWSRILYVWKSDSNNNDSDERYADASSFQVSADATPDIWEYVDIQLRAIKSNGGAEDDYNNVVGFRIRYDPNDDEMFTSSEEVSSYDFDNTNLFTLRWTYEDWSFSYSQNGSSYQNINDFIKFEKKGYYRIRWYDEDKTSIYWQKDFEVGMDNDDSDSTSNGRDMFTMVTNEDTPELNERVDLYVIARENGKIQTNYNDRVNFLVQRKWTNGQYTTASTTYYFMSRSSTILDMNGKKYDKLNDRIYFKTRGSYRVKIYADQDSSMNWYEYFVVK